MMRVGGTRMLMKSCWQMSRVGFLSGGGLGVAMVVGVDQ